MSLGDLIAVAELDVQLQYLLKFIMKTLVANSCLSVEVASSIPGDDRKFLFSCASIAQSIRRPPGKLEVSSSIPSFCVQLQNSFCVQKVASSTLNGNNLAC